MLQGYFENISPILKIQINTKPICFNLDTGFNGALMLPMNVIQKLKLKAIGKDKYIAANGAEVIADIYLAEIEWFGKKIKVDVLSTNGVTALLGMELLFDRKMIVDGKNNQVEIL